MKYVEYYSKSGDVLIEHGACHKDQIKFMLAENCTLTANLITDEAYAILLDSWLGSTIAPPVDAAPAQVSSIKSV